MSDRLCPIWGTQATFEPRVGDYEIVNSPRAGGRYWISGSYIAALESNKFSHEQKAMLTSELVTERISGNDLPRIGQGYIQPLEKRTPLRHSQKVERFFRWLNADNFQPGYRIWLKGPQSKKDRAIGRAWIEDLTDTQLEDYVKILADEGYIWTNGDVFKLTLKGCERLELLHGVNGESNQAFVAMWFGDAVKDAYTDGFASAIRAAGFDPMRIDKKDHINKVDDEIIAEIRRSRFVVADFTSYFVETGGEEVKTYIPRGGVYYEAGFAQGLGIPVIWTCRKDCINHLHFDTRQYAHIVWENPSDLKEQLTSRIGAVIGWGPNAKR